MYLLVAVIQGSLMGSTLKGMRVFIVEDEQLIVMLLEDMLDELGARVAAKSRNVPDALALAETADFDLAVLDLNLGGTKVFPVADRLKDLGKPFVFASGYGTAGIPDAYSSVPTVAKPYQQFEIAAALTQALATVGGSGASRD